MTIFSDNFYTSEPEQGPKFRKNWALIYWTLQEKQALCFFWMQNRLNIGVCMVRAISNIFALALEKRWMPLTYKQPKVI